MANETWWLKEVRHEWAGHRWRALEAIVPAKLLSEARIWAESPSGVLYVHARSLRDAFGFTVAVSQRAGQTLRRNHPELVEPLAVGLLDELSVPDDPDPEYTARTRSRHPAFLSRRHAKRLPSSVQSTVVRGAARPIAAASTGDPEGVLDQIADHRRNWSLPTLVASSVPPSQVTPAYGPRIGWRLGFAKADGSSIGLTTADASALDLDTPPC